MGPEAVRAGQGRLGGQSRGDQGRGAAMSDFQGVDLGEQPGEASGVANHAGVAAHGDAQLRQGFRRQVGDGRRAQRPTKQ